MCIKLVGAKSSLKIIGWKYWFGKPSEVNEISDGGSWENTKKQRKKLGYLLAYFRVKEEREAKNIKNRTKMESQRGKKKSFTERLSAKTSPRQCILPGGSRERGVNSLAWMRELNSEWMWGGRDGNMQIILLCLTVKRSGWYSQPKNSR